MDIYSVNDKLIDTLTKCELIVPTSRTFNLCATNADKVKFIRELLIKYDCIPKIDQRRAKDNNRSKELRQEGNNLFGRRKEIQALELYNESICWAENKDNTEDLAIGYANRSAVYHKLRMFEECNLNIELAKNAGYPEKLMEKLVKREMDCLEHINNDTDVKSNENNFVPKLHIQANSQIPFIANCLEMNESDDQGWSFMNFLIDFCLHFHFNQDDILQPTLN